jgi:hypothetical protein
MAKNRMSDLRDHLFEALEALKDPDKPMDLDRAGAVCQVAQTLINAAKVEVDAMKVVSGSSTTARAFFDLKEESRDLPKIGPVRN